MSEEEKHTRGVCPHCNGMIMIKTVYIMEVKERRIERG